MQVSTDPIPPGLFGLWRRRRGRGEGWQLIVTSSKTACEQLLCEMAKERRHGDLLVQRVGQPLPASREDNR